MSPGGGGARAGVAQQHDRRGVARDGRRGTRRHEPGRGTAREHPLVHHHYTSVRATLAGHPQAGAIAVLSGPGDWHRDRRGD